MTDRIAEHYANDGIAERILSAVTATLAPGTPLTAELLAAADQLHGRGLDATKELAALLDPKAGEHILDIGSGVGGPARWIASKFNCHVTGIDLTAAFCEAADELNRATALTDRVSIVHGSATSLPFADRTFDRAYSHNVIMNISDKSAFYREARRVLKPGGVLALLNLIAGSVGRPHYPAPWAASSATSFLATFEETRADLLAEGFEIIEIEDTTERSRDVRRAHAQRLEAGTAPVLGAHLVMGPRMKELQLNVIRSEEEGSIGSMQALVRRPL